MSMVVIQWNLSNKDTTGNKIIVLISEYKVGIQSNVLIEVSLN